MIILTASTTQKIKAYSTHMDVANSLLALMDYYHVTSLAEITEEMGIHFLQLLQNGDIIIGGFYYG